MASLPPDLNHKAPPWFHKFWDEVRQWLIDNRPIPGLNVEILDAPGGGKQISSKAPPPPSNTIYQPFELVDASEGDSKKIRVVAGTIGNGYPDGMSEGDDPPFVLDAVGSPGYIQGGITIDNYRSITSRWVEANSSPLEDDPDSGTFYVQIGTWYKNSEGNLVISNGRKGAIDVAVIPNYYASSFDSARYIVTWGSYPFSF